MMIDDRNEEPQRDSCIVQHNANTQPASTVSIVRSERRRKVGLETNTRPTSL